MDVLKRLIISIGIAFIALLILLFTLVVLIIWPLLLCIGVPVGIILKYRRDIRKGHAGWWP